MVRLVPAVRFVISVLLKMGLSFSGLVIREIRANLLRDHAESFQTFRLLKLSGDGTGSTIISEWHVDMLVIFARHVHVDPNSKEGFGMSSSWTPPNTSIVNETSSNADDFSQLRKNVVMDICVNYGYENTNLGRQAEEDTRKQSHLEKTRVALKAYTSALKEKREQLTPLETIADEAIKLGEIDFSTQMTLSLIAVENTLHQAFELRKAMKTKPIFHTRELLLRATKDFVTYAVNNFYAALTELMEESAENELFMSVAYEYIPIRRPKMGVPASRPI